MSEDKEKKFNMVITPAIPIEMRHKIINLLANEGYGLIGSGQFIDKSSCDISFVKKE